MRLRPLRPLALALAACALNLAGCRTLCPAPGVTQTAFSQDSYACMQISPAMGGATWRVGINREMHNACMLAKGHVIKRGGCD